MSISEDSVINSETFIFMKYNDHYLRYIREAPTQTIRTHTFEGVHLASYYYGINNNGNKEEAIRVDISLEDKPSKNIKKYDVTIRIPSFNSIHSDAIRVINLGENNWITTIWWKLLGWIQGLEQFCKPKKK